MIGRIADPLFFSSPASSPLRIGAYFYDFATDQGGALMFGGVVVTMVGVGLRLLTKNTTSKSKRGSSQPADAISATADHVLAILLSCWFFYLFVFHSLANLPLHNKLLFGVHQRFWMQPNIFAFMFAGVGLGKSYSYVCASVLPKTKRINLAVFVAVLFGSLAFAFQKTYARVDQSDNYYFDYYAKSIVENLPPNSLLIINYDQQWTSVRYLMECEGLRPDVVTMNLSMMRFLWWESKKLVYDGFVEFPGTHYAKKGSVGHTAFNGFTFEELLEANIDKFPGGVYLGGKLNFQEEEVREAERQEERRAVSETSRGKSCDSGMDVVARMMNHRNTTRSLLQGLGI